MCIQWFLCGILNYVPFSGKMRKQSFCGSYEKPQLRKAGLDHNKAEEPAKYKTIKYFTGSCPQHPGKKLPGSLG